MKSLCFFATLMTVAVALPPRGSVEINKRLLGLGGGGGGLLGTVLGGEGGGLVGTILGGEEGGLVGSILGGEEGGLVGSILGGEEGGLVGSILGGGEGGFLGGIFDTLLGEQGIITAVLETATGLVDTVLDIIGSLTGGLEGKTEEADMRAEFEKHDLNKLCPVCVGLPKPEYVSACKNYCTANNWKPQ